MENPVVSADSQVSALVIELQSSESLPHVYYMGVSRCAEGTLNPNQSMFQTLRILLGHSRSLRNPSPPPTSPDFQLVSRYFKLVKSLSGVGLVDRLMTCHAFADPRENENLTSFHPLCLSSVKKHSSIWVLSIAPSLPFVVSIDCYKHFNWAVKK